MKIVILTTDTTHHLYFAWKIASLYPLTAVFFETKKHEPPFAVTHPFEQERDAYEREHLLVGFRGGWNDLAEIRSVRNMNDAGSVSLLGGFSPEAILVFGTGKLVPAVFECASLVALNLHGGNTEEYRGLDTHLWAIYHEDFDNLITTLHHLDATLDTGDIVCQSNLVFPRNARLHELRAVNTKVCTDLSLSALATLAATGSLPRRKQLRRGRYYSYMPAVLKDICVKKFERYTAAV